VLAEDEVLLSEVVNHTSDGFFVSLTLARHSTEVSLRSRGLKTFLCSEIGLSVQGSSLVAFSLAQNLSSNGRELSLLRSGIKDGRLAYGEVAARELFALGFLQGFINFLNRTELLMN
jgi:hypothetical protein